MKRYGSTVPSPKKRVAVYAHVVSKPLDDLWLVQQVEPLKRFVEAHADWEWHKVYADAAILVCQPRPQIKALLQDCDAGNIDIVITASASHLAREMSGLLRIMERLLHLNIELIRYQEAISFNDPVLTFLWEVASVKGGIEI